MSEKKPQMILPVQPRDSLDYYPEAWRARHLEQTGKYSQASKAWEKAGLVSCNKVNQNWSRQRAEFCVKQTR